MSRLNELKKQYPQLNLTFFDLMTRIDTSKSYKYLPLMCKIFAKRFDPKKHWGSEDYSRRILELNTNLISRSISTDNLNDSQMYFLWLISDFLPTETFSTLSDFIYYMEHNRIENKDVTSYDNLDDVRSAISLASLKEMEDHYSSQVIKEYEDETWLAVRPLTFGASSKYGSSTRWCTTYKNEKQYFERYWRQGVLVYFINKKTGYKFAMFKSLVEKDLSFWNAEDSRVDTLSLEIDDYMFPIIRTISKSELSNKNLSSNEIQEQVHQECIDVYEIKTMSVREPEPMEELRLYGEEPVEEDISPTQRA